jgi:hypothetical protein
MLDPKYDNIILRLLIVIKMNNLQIQYKSGSFSWLADHKKEHKG